MLKHMSLAEMTSVSGLLVDKTARRDTFLSIPEVAPLHPQVIAAHNAVLAAQPTDTQPSPEMVTILQKETAADVRHDRLARASSFSLETEREHCLAASEPDEARAAMCDRVYSQIFPDGLTIINTSYAAEAGNTARVAKLLQDQPQIGQFLQTIVVPVKKPGKKNGAPAQVTLLDTIEEWIAVGRELQKLEEQRQDLVAKQGTPVATQKIMAVRAQWTRIMSAVLNNLEISTAPAEAIEAIRGPILEASERAEKRYPAKSASGAAADETAAADDANPAPQPAKAKAPADKAPAPAGTPQ